MSSKYKYSLYNITAQVKANDCYTNKAEEALGHSGKLKVPFKQEETCSSTRLREGGGLSAITGSGLAEGDETNTRTTCEDSSIPLKTRATYAN